MMKKNQNKFMFYENFLEAIEQLPDAEKGNACLEFCRYGITGSLPANKYIAMFCLGVSASVQKYQGRGGARIGAGRPKKQENQEVIENQKNQKNQKIQKQQTETLNINIKEKYKEKFEEWWGYYPKLRAGSKARAYTKYVNAIEKEKLTPEFLLLKVKEYSESDEVKKGYACGAEVYFNKCKYNNQYGNSGMNSEKAREEEKRLSTPWWRE